MNIDLDAEFWALVARCKWRPGCFVPQPDERAWRRRLAAWWQRGTA